MHNTTYGQPPRLPYLAIKEAVLGKDYDLSLVFVGDKRSQTLNQAYKQKNKPASVLSFPLEKRAGEIYLNLPLAKRRQARYQHSYKKAVGHLFIHALFHLKGYDHSSTMEKREIELCQRFGLAHPY